MTSWHWSQPWDSCQCPDQVLTTPNLDTWPLVTAPHPPRLTQLHIQSWPQKITNRKRNKIKTDLLNRSVRCASIFSLWKLFFHDLKTSEEWHILLISWAVIDHNIINADNLSFYWKWSDVWYNHLIIMGQYCNNTKIASDKHLWQHRFGQQSTQIKTIF